MAQLTAELRVARAAPQAATKACVALTRLLHRPEDAPPLTYEMDASQKTYAAVLASLRAHAAHAETQAAACTALAALSFVPGVDSPVPDVLTTLRTHATHAEVQAAGLEVLAAYGRGNSTRKREVATAGACEIAAVVMRAYATEPAVQLAGCRVMSAADGVSSSGGLAEGVLEVLVTALRSADEMVQFCAMEALCQIMRATADGQWQAAQAGAIDAVLSALRATADADLHAVGCVVLRLLVQQHRPNCVRAIAGGAVEMVPLVMHAHAHIAQLLAFCCELLYALFTGVVRTPNDPGDPASLHTLVDALPHTLEAVFAAMGAHLKSVPVQLRGLQVLQAVDQIYASIPCATKAAAAPRTVHAVVAAMQSQPSDGNIQVVGLGLFIDMVNKKLVKYITAVLNDALPVVVAALALAANAERGKQQEEPMMADIMWRSTSLLDFFLRNETTSLCVKASDAGVHSALVEALGAFPSLSVQERCCTVLYHVLCCRELSCHMPAVEANVMAALAVVLRTHTASPALCFIAAVTMRALLAGPARNRLHADGASALSALAGMMRAHPLDVKLQDMGCAVLSYVAALGGDADDEAGAFAAVTSALCQFHSDVDLQRHGCRALAVLASREKGSVPHARCAGAVAAVVAALVAHPTVLSVQKDGCDALRSLAYLSPHCRKEACTAGAFKPLVRLLRTLKLHPDVQAAGYEALLALVSDDPACQQCALKAGALDIVPKSVHPSRKAVDALLRRIVEDGNKAATADADAAAASLLAELEAESAAQQAAQQKRKAKKKPRGSGAAVALPGADDAPPVDEAAAAGDAMDDADARAAAPPPQEHRIATPAEAGGGAPAHESSSDAAGDAAQAAGAGRRKPAGQRREAADEAASATVGAREGTAAAPATTVKQQVASHADAAQQPQAQEDDAQWVPAPPRTRKHRGGGAGVEKMADKPVQLPVQKQAPAASSSQPAAPQSQPRQQGRMPLPQPRGTPQPRSAAQPSALPPLFLPLPQLLPPAPPPPLLPLQAQPPSPPPPPASQQQHFPHAPLPHSLPPSAPPVPPLAQQMASQSLFSPYGVWAPPVTSYGTGGGGGGGGAPASHPPHVPPSMAPPPSFLPYVPPSAQPPLPPPDLGASLPAPARRVPPPYRPPSGAPSAGMSAMGLVTQMLQQDEESAPQPPGPSVFVAVDALAAQTARQSIADRVGGDDASVAPSPLPSMLPPAPAPSASVPPTPSSSSASGPGLANATGEYNCFLNSLVQALFHLRCFREYLLANSVPSAAVLAARSGRDVSCSVALVASLQELFVALRSGVALRRDASGGAPGVAAPTALRHALAALSPSGEGGLHAMADASEVLCHMYDAFAAVSAASRANVCEADDTPVARMFGMIVAEHVACASRRCGVRTHELKYTQFFHIAHAAALRDASGAAEAATASLGDPAAPAELLLSRLMAADAKPCDKDKGGCGMPAPTRHELARAPAVFTLSLAWDTATAAEEEVAATMKALSTRLHPQRVYGGEDAAHAPGADADVPYELRAMVCYYGSHYASFARTDDARSSGGVGAGAGGGPSGGSCAWGETWTRFDDAAVTRVGGWAAVCDACARGHLQPTVLFYERPQPKAPLF
jgi:hypothetical protein